MQVVSALWVDEIRKHDDGRIDLLGLYEDLFVPELPVTLESLSLFLEVAFDPADRGERREIVLSLTGPDGAPLQPPSHLRFTPPPVETYPRASAPLDPALFEVTLRAAGEHHLTIAVDGVVQRTLPLYVSLA